MWTPPLEFEDGLVPVPISRFGLDCVLRNDDDECFSRVFLSLLMSYMASYRESLPEANETVDDVEEHMEGVVVVVVAVVGFTKLLRSLLVCPL